LLRSSTNLDEFYYEMYWTGTMELEVSEDGETTDVEMITRVYLKEGLMRIETDYMGYTSVEIYDEDAFYYLDDESKIAYMSPLELVDEPVTLDAYVDDVDESNIHYVGKETVQGVSCHVMECKGLYTGFNLKMWLHEEYGFPMRVESSNDGDNLLVMELTEFQVGSLSDDLFKVPEEYLIDES
ncbi:MAG TPA: DUF4412 domain-containing protein, partial [Proteiniclasticum sp.]|nr:DUF4412 domain-containing protein [Proteiniclasticum sp.]